MNSLSNIDIIVILVYLVGIVLYGISKSKRSSSEDYFLGGRTMTWPIVGIALFSANISSSTLVGLASDAFQTNVSVYNYEWYAVVVLIFFAIFFLPFYLSMRDSSTNEPITRANPVFTIAEMEAELLTGKELNLEKAREAALNNDNVTLMEEISKNFGSMEEFGKMNRIQLIRVAHKKTKNLKSFAPFKINIQKREILSNFKKPVFDFSLQYPRKNGFKRKSSVSIEYSD